MSKILIFLLLFFTTSIVAQERYPLKSAEFYKPLEKVYQDWLETKSLDKYFSVVGSDTLDGFLTFYLQFKVTTDDSAYFLWENLKQNFQGLHGFPIEEWLFKNYISIVKTNPKYTNLQLYSKNKEGGYGQFYRGIYFKDKTIKTIERNGTAKYIDPKNLAANFSAMRAIRPTKLLVRNTKYKLKVNNTKYTKSKVYDKITNFAKSKYIKKLENPKRDFYIDNSRSDILYFEIRNLKGEVFADEDNNFIAEFITWFSDTKVDWRTIEELHFNIKFIPIGSSRNFILEFDIDGRYGSGFHGINDWEKMFDMEKDFDPKLERYQQQFANEVYDYLTK